MGCNTSKEVQTADDAKNKADVKENGDAMEDNHVEGVDDKAASAKTITLRSASRPNSTTSTEKAEAATPEPDAERPEVNGEGEEHQLQLEEDVEDEAKAAVKIQAVFRGHQARKTMKQSDKPATPEPEPEPTREELEAEFRADDKELCHAATKIQASFRGHMSRKNKDGEGNKEDDGEAGGNTNPEEEELDIDLTDPELSKAAVKIQASFRGHMARKDVDGPK